MLDHKGAHPAELVIAEPFGTGQLYRIESVLGDFAAVRDMDMRWLTRLGTVEKKSEAVSTQDSRHNGIPSWPIRAVSHF